MYRGMDRRKILSVILWLIAVHSFTVGVGMILMPTALMEFLGFKSGLDRFFSYQGGVFHIIMAVAYLLAAQRSERFEVLVLFSIIVKFSATVFLFVYYLFAAQLLLVLFSGVTDFLMGIALLWAYTSYTGKRLKEV
jgi:hypothetical protein